MDTQKPPVIYVAQFLSDPEELFTTVRDQTKWDERMKARLTASFGVPYNYSGMSYPETPMPPEIVRVAAALSERLGFEPNNCLANYYKSGESNMGFHRDSIAELVEGTGVAIVSLGAVRTLCFRRVGSKKIVCGYPLVPGSLLYMPPEMQLDWNHGVPPEPEARGRISLTFRMLKPEFSENSK